MDGSHRRAIVALLLLGGSCAVPCRPSVADDGAVSAHISGMGGSESTLSLTYSPPVDAEAATADVRAIGDLSGWAISQPVASDASAATYTSRIAPAIMPGDVGASVLYPLVAALRRYPVIGITLVGASTGPPGEFEGQNRWIYARWTRTGNVTRYTIRVDDDSVPGPEALVLPDRPALQSPSGGAPASGTTPASTRGPWLLLIAASLGTGLAVWGLTSWLLSLWVPRRRAGSATGGTEQGPERSEPS